MQFKKFNEYLDEKGRLMGKPKKKEITNAKAPKKKDDLAHTGDQKLVYTPKVAPLQQNVGSPWKKSSVKEWIKENRKLSTADFVKKISSEKFNVEIDYSKIKNNQDLIEAVIYLLKENKGLVENLVISLNRSNLLSLFLNEVKVLREAVSAPIGSDSSEDYVDDEREDNDDGDDEEDLEGDKEYDYDNEDNEDLEDEDEGEDLERDDDEEEGEEEYDYDDEELEDDEDLEDEDDEDLEDEEDEDLEDEEDDYEDEDLEYDEEDDEEDNFLGR